MAIKFKGLKKLLGKLAPTLAAGLGGPLAPAAVKFLGNALLGSDDANEADLEAAIAKATPQELAKLKEIDNNYRIEMERIDVDIFALETKDTQNAREAAISVKMIPQMVLSMVFIVGYFLILWMLFSGKVEIDETMRDMANILIGVITANIPQIMAFWFGSSHGSKSKKQEK